MQKLKKGWNLYIQHCSKCPQVLPILGENMGAPHAIQMFSFSVLASLSTITPCSLRVLLSAAACSSVGDSLNCCYVTVALSRAEMGGSTLFTDSSLYKSLTKGSRVFKSLESLESVTQSLIPHRPQRP